MAALALGADAVSMGSRFMASRESGDHTNSRQAVVSYGVEDTIRSTHYDGVPLRAISTPLARKIARRKPSLIQVYWRARQMAIQSGTSVQPMLKGFPRNIKFLHFLAWIGHGMYYMLRGIEQADLKTGMTPHSIPSVDVLGDSTMA